MASSAAISIQCTTKNNNEPTHREKNAIWSIVTVTIDLVIVAYNCWSVFE